MQQEILDIMITRTRESSAVLHDGTRISWWPKVEDFHIQLPRYAWAYLNCSFFQGALCNQLRGIVVHEGLAAHEGSGFRIEGIF